MKRNLSSVSIQLYRGTVYIGKRKQMFNSFTLFLDFQYLPEVDLLDDFFRKTIIINL